MNGRKARALRRAATRMTPGLPARQLVTTAGRVVPVQVQGYVVPFRLTGTLSHKPTTTRAVYQKLKKVYGHANLGTLK